MHLKRHGKLFMKYLLSYILILFIPLIIINTLFSGRFIKAFREETLSNVQADLKQLSSIMDKEMSTMSSTVNQISLSQNLHGYQFKDNPLSAKDIIASLSVYCATNKYVNEMFIYFHDDDYMLSSGSTCRTEFFLNHLYRFSKIPPQQLLESLNNITKPTLLHSQAVQTLNGVDDYITIIHPIYTDYQTIKGSTIFFIKSSTILNLIDSNLQKYSASTYITDADNNIILSSNPINIPSEQLSDYLNSPDQNALYTINNDHYLIRSFKSPELGWKYITFIPEHQQVFDKLFAITKELYITTFLVLMIASLAILMVMKMNYSPIQRLREKAVKISELNQHHGELETISDTLDYLSDQNTYLTTKLEANISSIKNVRLQTLLTGGYKNVEDFNQHCAEVHLSFNNHYFFVGTILVHGDPDDWDKFALRIQSILKKYFESNYIFTLEPHKIITINCIKENQRKAVANIFEKMHRMIEKETGFTITIGLGNICESTATIAKSYLESTSALDYRFVKGNGNVILFDEIYSANQNYSAYPHNEFERLKNAILTSNDEAITEYINNIINYVDKNNLPLFIAKGICFDMISVFIECVKENGILCEAKTNIFALTDVDTAHDVINIIKELRDSLHKLSVSNLKSDSDSLLNEIIAYINKNCLLCDFSVQKISEKFDMLLPNLSQFFKDKTGQNILDYSTSQRMKKAKKLLAETQIPLKEVAYQVGYCNTSSFIRRFKQTQGVTPGDYRKLNVTESSTAQDK